MTAAADEQKRGTRDAPAEKGRGARPGRPGRVAWHDEPVMEAACPRCGARPPSGASVVTAGPAGGEPRSYLVCEAHGAWPYAGPLDAPT